VSGHERLLLSAWEVMAVAPGAIASPDGLPREGWTPATVPTATATFGFSNVTGVTFSVDTTVGGWTLTTGATNYVFTNNNALTFNGAGILIGAVVGGLSRVRQLLLPVFSSLYAVPIVILYPIFTAWLGVGSQSKIAFAAVYGFFPVMLSTAAGIQSIDQNFLVAARSMGASMPQQITRVVIPASMPTVLAGLRLGGALALIGVIVSEMLTAAAGIGYLVSKYRTVLDSPRVFAAILMILVLSVLFDALARWVERRALTWQTAGRRDRGLPVEETYAGATLPA